MNIQFGVRIRFSCVCDASPPILSAHRPSPQAAPTQMPGKPAFQGKAYRFDKIAEGVYYATATGSMITGGNNTVIVNDRDVLSGRRQHHARRRPRNARRNKNDHATSPCAGWSTRISTTTTPTATSVYGPDVEIIATDYVRDMLAHHDVLHTEPFKTSVGSLPTQIDALKKQAAGEKDPAKHADLEKQIKAMQDEIEQVKEVKPTPPTMTFPIANSRCIAAIAKSSFFFSAADIPKATRSCIFPRKRLSAPET